MNPEIRETIEKTIKNNKVVLFMKGTPDFPQCGFSAATVQCVQQLGVPFEAIDVLADIDIRQGIKEYSEWPTIPQLYINGEFVGGCDITRQLAASGELSKLVQK